MNDDLYKQASRCPINNLWCGVSCLDYARGRCKAPRFAVPCTSITATISLIHRIDLILKWSIVRMRERLIQRYEKAHPREMLWDRFSRAVRRYIDNWD